MEEPNHSLSNDEGIDNSFNISESSNKEDNLSTLVQVDDESFKLKADDANTSQVVSNNDSVISS